MGTASNDNGRPHISSEDELIHYDGELPAHVSREIKNLGSTAVDFIEKIGGLRIEMRADEDGEFVRVHGGNNTGWGESFHLALVQLIRRSREHFPRISDESKSIGFFHLTPRDGYTMRAVTEEGLILATIRHL